MSLDCSACVISWIRRFAAAAAARFGLKGGTSGSSLELALGVQSTDNSSGHRCCTARSITPFPARTLAARMISSPPPTISGSGEYHQFLANRVNKIQQLQGIAWHHVPKDQNPADPGSRGGSVISAPLWMNGPPWLSYQDQWPRLKLRPLLSPEQKWR